jgi:hypothetical protein
LLGRKLPAFDATWALRARKATTTNAVKAARASIVWRRVNGWDIARVLLEYLRWVKFPRLLLRALLAEGGSTKRRFGRGLLGQSADIVKIAVANGLTPEDYYSATLARCSGGPEIYRYLPFDLILCVAAWIANDDPHARSHPIFNKLAFEEKCRMHGIRVVRTIALANETTIVTPDGNPFAGLLPDRDIIIKPIVGSQGRGMEMWRSDGSGHFVNAKEGRLSSSDLAKLASSLAGARRCSMLLQERLENHPDLRPVAGTALATTRIVTMFNEDGQPEIVDSFYRTSVVPGVAVDNFHNGGLLFPIDIATGALRPGMGDWPYDERLITHHPETGTRVAGFKHPAWPAMAQLAPQLHRLFPDLVMPGWDIGFDKDGPVLVEGNRVSGISMNRQPLLGGVAGTRAFTLLAYHAKRWLEANEPERSRWRCFDGFERD